MSKKPTEEVILRITLTLTLAISLLVFVFIYFVPEDQKIIGFLFIPIIVFLVSYYSIRYVFNEHLLKRIKKIYKSINVLRKQEKLQEESRKGVDIISEAEEDVDAWTRDRIAEIDYLKQTDLFRKEFIGNLAHELKTPIFSIQGYILTLLEEGALEDPENNVKFLTKAAKGTDRLVSLVEDLDSVAKIESGIFVPEMTRFNIVVLVKEVMESLEHAANKRNIKLTTDVPDKKKIYVLADRKRIEQVLTNLISNSISYGNENGRTKVKIKPGKKKVSIEVADNGIGINEENLKRIFERFYRVDKSRSRQHGGSGLGLAIVKHIIEAHDQQITVRSTEGKGSNFTFTLEIAS